MNEAIVNLHDHERAARSVMDEAAWAYFSGGAADEITLRRNMAAWQQWALMPRVLRNLQDSHTRCQLLGREWPFPLLVAPMALQRWAHPEGEAGMAMAAAAQRCGMVLSHQSSTSLQDVASLVQSQSDRGPLWFQMYWQTGEIRRKQLLREVEDAGYEALVLTVDAPIQGARDRERRHNAAPPEGVHTVHWHAQTPSRGQGLCNGMTNAAPTWNDVEKLIGQTRLPVLLKGIAHPDDARQAVGIGAAGVVVSNHGGRVLDTLPATAELLACVAQAARQQRADALVLVDGGIRRGTDLVKALALGADAALIGRPALYGLAHAGARGAAHVLRLLRDEFEAALALTGCACVRDLNTSHLRALAMCMPKD